MLFLFSFFFILNSISAAKLHDSRQVAGIFSVVKFANEACDSSSTSYNGTCFTAAECEANGGTASGTCAEGFGVCCVITISSGGKTSANNTHLIQSSTTTSGAQTYTICPSSTDICSIRIDFEKFVMSAASTTAGIRGNCADDTLTITNPSGNNPPLLCGTLTGQHMYLDASPSCHTINSIISSSDTSTTREWNIKVTQVECSSQNKPPAGCLQYFTGITGYLYNYGWQGASSLAASTTYHMNNQDYTMCIRREEGYCSMEYFSPTTGFGVSVEPNPATAAFGDVECIGDYVQIPGLLPSGSTAATAFPSILGDRICGDAWTGFPNPTATAATFMTFTKPFRVGVHFDSTEGSPATTHSNGFAILYTQKKCT